LTTAIGTGEAFLAYGSDDHECIYDEKDELGRSFTSYDRLAIPSDEDGTISGSAGSFDNSPFSYNIASGMVLV